MGIGHTGQQNRFLVPGREYDFTDEQKESGGIQVEIGCLQKV